MLLRPSRRSHLSLAAVAICGPCTSGSLWLSNRATCAWSSKRPVDPLLLAAQTTLCELDVCALHDGPVGRARRRLFWVPGHLPRIHLPCRPVGALLLPSLGAGLSSFSCPSRPYRQMRHDEPTGAVPDLLSDLHARSPPNLCSSSSTPAAPVLTRVPSACLHAPGLLHLRLCRRIRRYSASCRVLTSDALSRRF